ncbi:MAG: sulfatase [Acidobacteriota bacterium]|nr:sulfatase [Acidobacteriota bacterium]
MRIAKPLLLIIPVMTLSGSLFWGCGQGRKASVAEKTPRNLVLIVSDALRRDMLGCYGGEAHTPHIDRLAREGTLFENAYSTAPCTLPSSVAMLTGNYSRTYAKILHSTREEIKSSDRPEYCYYVPDSETLLAEVLSERGWENRADIENPVVSRSNILQGFLSLSAGNLPEQPQVDRLQSRIGFQMRNHGYRAMIASLDFLLSASNNRKFFLLKWIMDPHGPYQPPDRFRRPLLDVEKTLPNPPSFYMNRKSPQLQQLLAKKTVSASELEYIRRLYRAEVEAVDERVGYMLAALRMSGTDKDTLIVFTSDHGELIGEHGRIGHGQAFFQELVRIPLILCGPGIPGGKRLSARVTHLGLSPTLADLMKAKLPEDPMGKSFASLLHSDSRSEGSAYFDAMVNTTKPKWRKWDAGLQDQWKLIMNRGQTPAEIFLFNLDEDPGESRNVCADFPEVAESLRIYLARAREQIRKRLQRNAARLNDEVDLHEKARKARETLESLGYL